MCFYFKTCIFSEKCLFVHNQLIWLHLFEVIAGFCVLKNIYLYEQHEWLSEENALFT